MLSQQTIIIIAIAVVLVVAAGIVAIIVVLKNKKPADPMFSCTNGVCVVDAKGTYKSKDECAAKSTCVATPITALFACLNGYCIEDAKGIYKSKDECVAKSKCVTAPPSAGNYRCNGDTGGCVPDTTGAYADEKSCKAACKKVVAYGCCCSGQGGLGTETRVLQENATEEDCLDGYWSRDRSCIDARCGNADQNHPVFYSCLNGQCVLDPNGIYTSCPDCSAGKAPRGACCTEFYSGACYDDYTKDQCAPIGTWGGEGSCCKMTCYGEEKC